MNLGDLALFKNGKARPNSFGSYPVYGGNGILDFTDKFNSSGEVVIVGRVGAYCGSVYYEDKETWISDNAMLATPKQRYDTKFLFYFLKNLDLNSFAEGSSHPLLTQNLLNSIEVYATDDPNTQRAIAEVLSSLDDKIDLLHRQNKTLESLSQNLFRQWFIEEADTNWDEVDLGYVTSRITDGAHGSPRTVENGLPMASVKDMYEWGIHTESCRTISKADFDELVRNDCRPLKDDIVIAKDGSYLKHVFVAREDMDLVILSSIAILRPNGKYNPLLLATFLKMPSTRIALENIVTGAVIPRIVLKDFRAFPLLLPPIESQNKALETIEPIFKKCWSNCDQIATLIKLRDSLLPKLMSGEVQVPN